MSEHSKRIGFAIHFNECFYIVQSIFRDIIWLDRWYSDLSAKFWQMKVRYLGISSGTRRIKFHWWHSNANDEISLVMNIVWLLFTGISVYNLSTNDIEQC